MGRTVIDLCNKSCSEWRDLIDEWIYSERDRCIIKRRLLDGICYEELSEEFDLSDRQVKRICNKCVEQLSKHV